MFPILDVEHLYCNLRLMNIALLKDYKAKNFWKWFVQHSEQYFSMDGADEKLLDDLSAQLRKISPFACFEISTVHKGKRELILSADGVAKGVEAILNLVKAAPPIDNWEIIAFRPRIEVERIEFEGLDLQVKDISYAYNFNEYNRVDLHFYIKGFDENDKDRYIGGTLILLDTLIGEYDSMTKIGALEFSKLQNKTTKNLDAMTKLPQLLDSRRGNSL